MYEEWLVKNIRTRAKRITNFFFCYVPLFLCVFAMYFPFMCLLNEVRYLYVFVTRYFIHTVNFPVENFIHCYLLALVQSSYWEGVILACSCVRSLDFLFWKVLPPCPYCPYVCLPTKCFLHNKCQFVIITFI